MGIMIYSEQNQVDFKRGDDYGLNIRNHSILNFTDVSYTL